MATIGRGREAGRREAFHAGIFPGRGLRFNMDKVTIIKYGDEIPNIYPPSLSLIHTLTVDHQGHCGFPILHVYKWLVIVGRQVAYLPRGKGSFMVVGREIKV
jgi:hypothetical protein